MIKKVSDNLDHIVFRLCQKSDGIDKKKKKLRASQRFLSTHQPLGYCPLYSSETQYRHQILVVYLQEGYMKGRFRTAIFMRKNLWPEDPSEWVSNVILWNFSLPFSKRLSFSRGLSSTSVGLMDLSLGLGFVSCGSCLVLGIWSLIFSELVPIDNEKSLFWIYYSPSQLIQCEIEEKLIQKQNLKSA